MEKNHIIFPVFKFFTRFSKNYDLSIPGLRCGDRRKKVQFVKFLDFPQRLNFLNFFRKWDYISLKFL